MKRGILVTTVLAVMSFMVQAQRIKGSDTVLLLSQMEAENYMKADASRSVTVTDGGSSVGIAALLEGKTEIAQTSRKIRFDERQKLQERGKTIKEVVIAYDALAVVTHPSNKVTNLTREQLEGIFTGKIKNWKEVGGEDMKIVPYARETSSGTYEFFRESVLQNKNYVSGIISMPTNGTIIQSVSQNREAIGYVGLASLSKEVKVIHISYDKGSTFTEPSVENAKNETYPVVRPLFYYYEAGSEKKVEDFIGYVLSPEGQQIVSETGFVTVL